jgi:two-component sensor histidine kinase
VVHYGIAFTGQRHVQGEITMLDMGRRPHDGILQSHPDAHVEKGADDWELVLRENHHRMKNTLTLLGASVRRDFRRGEPKEFAAAVDRFEHRVVAFGRLYHLLSSGADSTTMSVADFLANLCGALSEAILQPVGIRCEASIEDGALPAAQCHRLGLMVTELVTNAAKHAFPDNQAGVVRVEASQRDGCWYCTVADNGTGAIGPLRGTGGRILEGLARSIRAQLHGEAGRSGTAVTIMLPVA